MKVLDRQIRTLLHEGTVIPAHPLALNEHRQLDEDRQRLLTRYYMASGAGGVAAGVHTTQFEIRKPEIALLEPVLRLAADEIQQADLKRPFAKVAGIVGPEKQALAEAELALKYDYDIGLLSMGGLPHLTEAEIIQRAYKVSEIIPLFGFYLQPAVGGRLFSYEFWHDFAQIPALEAIKVAAFNRYQTLDVVRAVCHSPRRDEIALYTGNDDNIVADLLTPYHFEIDGKMVEKRFTGGLLGHWAVWTHAAMRLLKRIKECDMNDGAALSALLATGVAVTDMNAAIFDPKNDYEGCIPGIHEVLRRQGILEGRWCLNPQEELSPGQMEEIDRVCRNYPDLIDDDFVSGFIRQDK